MSFIGGVRLATPGPVGISNVEAPWSNNDSTPMMALDGYALDLEHLNVLVLSAEDCLCYNN